MTYMKTKKLHGPYSPLYKKDVEYVRNNIKFYKWGKKTKNIRVGKIFKKNGFLYFYSYHERRE